MNQHSFSALGATFRFFAFGVLVSRIIKLLLRCSEESWCDANISHHEKCIRWQNHKSTVCLVRVFFFFVFRRQKEIRWRTIHRIRHTQCAHSDVFVRWRWFHDPQKFLPGLSFGTCMAAGTRNSSSRKLMHNKFCFYWDRDVITTTITIILFAFYDEPMKENLE